jgi:hypothetical protein
MKSKTTANAGAKAKNHKTAQRAPSKALIHPVVIYPYRTSADFSDLEALYQLVARLDSDKSRYARPITVIDRKTVHACEWNQQFLDFRNRTVAEHSDLVEAWCVDTCQMWYTGLGKASEKGGAEDVYWLIPGDFNYGTPLGKIVLDHIHDLPEIVEELNQDFCIGETVLDHANPKELIDTYGTFALLYNWFPEQAREIRRLTQQPRSEFFAVRHSFLRELLTQRWYPYEQTLVMVLLAVCGSKPISRFSVGDITDLPPARESLPAAMQQVERIERVLKMMWRERNSQLLDWPDRYRELELQSDEIRRAALSILRNLV